MSSILSPESTLTLTPHARFYSAGDGHVLATPGADYTFRGRGAAVFDKVKFLLDGSSTLGGVAAASGVTFDDLGATLETLLEGGALRDVTALLAAKNPGEFLETYFPLCDTWSLEIFGQPFWEAMLGGHASPSVVLGWGLEFYHRVVGADEHNALSVNYCRDGVIAGWLRDHFAEESDHGFIFLDGLVSCGFDRQQVVESPPLPSTRALINYLNTLASTDLVSYLGCYGVMHSPRVGQTRENIDRQYTLLKRHYGFARGLLDKIHEHALIDIDLGHDEIVFERVLSRCDLGDGAVAVKTLGAVKGIVTAFVNFFGGIYDYYQSPGAQLPRRQAAAAA
jgi:hypothetical protein